MFEKALEFFVEYLLIATILIVTLGVGWTLGIQLRNNTEHEVRQTMQHEAIAAGVARYNPVDKRFEWIPPGNCDAK